MQYKVTISEFLKRDIIVDAISANDAKDIAYKLYKICDIVLDWNVFYEVNFSAVKDENIFTNL